MVLLALAALGAANATNGDDAGRRLFVKDATPPCALCHTLADAGATANVGPSLDELKPDAQRVTQAVKAGIGANPAYTQQSASGRCQPTQSYRKNKCRRSRAMSHAPRAPQSKVDRPTSGRIAASEAWPSGLRHRS